jgi:hypothetical protein
MQTTKRSVCIPLKFASFFSWHLISAKCVEKINEIKIKFDVEKSLLIKHLICGNIISLGWFWLKALRLRNESERVSFSFFRVGMYWMWEKAWWRLLVFFEFEEMRALNIKWALWIMRDHEIFVRQHFFDIDGYSEWSIDRNSYFSEGFFFTK